MSGKGFLGNMTENLQADCVQSRQAGFMQCFHSSATDCIKQLYYYTIKSAICQEKTAKFFRRFPKSFLFNAAEKIMAKNDDCLLKKQKKQMKFCTKKKGLAFSGQIFYNKGNTE